MNSSISSLNTDKEEVNLGYFKVFSLKITKFFECQETPK